MNAQYPPPVTSGPDADVSTLLRIAASLWHDEHHHAEESEPSPPNRFLIEAERAYYTEARVRGL